MTVTIMRQIKFNAGHRLLGHEGKCANLHGHNYVAQIFVSGKETDHLGRIVDFSVINKLFKGWIDENWDHSVILWTEDEKAIQAISQMGQNRISCLPYNPTAENMARYLLLEVAPHLISELDGYDICVTKVVIWETENSSAEVCLENHSSNDIANRSFSDTSAN